MPEGEFKTMQEEAIRRVQEMQRRSKSFVETPQPPPTPTPPAAPEKPKAREKGVLFNIAGIAIDEEKALIALLIYILYKNQADMKLLLALGYLLL